MSSDRGGWIPKSCYWCAGLLRRAVDLPCQKSIKFAKKFRSGMQPCLAVCACLLRISILRVPVSFTLTNMMTARLQMQAYARCINVPAGFKISGISMHDSLRFRLSGCNVNQIVALDQLSPGREYGCCG